MLAFVARSKKAKNRPATDEEKRDRPPVTHPLIRTHPETRRKVLYVGIHTSHIVDRPQEEGRKLLDELTTFAGQDDFVYTHEWQPGDLVMWDNRCLLHRALPYEATKEPRQLRGTRIAGEADGLHWCVARCRAPLGKA